MVSRWLRGWDSKVLQPFLGVVARTGIGPNGLTLSGLGLIVLAGILFAFAQWWWGLAALILGSILDGIDGELARLLHAESNLGAFLDSICDHLGDLAIYLGFMWYFIAINNHTAIILILLAMFGSLFGSHVRSRAGMVGINTRQVGLFTRFERMLVLMAGILVNQLLVALWIVAIFANLSALQRIYFTFKAARRQEPASQD